MHFSSILTRNGLFLFTPFSVSSYKSVCLLGQRAVTGGNKRLGCGGKHIGPSVLKIWRRIVRSSGLFAIQILPGLQVPSQSLTSIYVAPFIFQSTSMPVPSFNPQDLLWQRKKPGQGRGGVQAVMAEFGGARLPPAALSAHRLCPTASWTSLWWLQVLGHLHAGSQVLLQGGDLTRPLSSSSRPQRSMLRVPQTRDTCASPSPLAQTRLPAGEGSDRIPILGFFPAAPRASSSEVLAESVQEIQGKNSTRHRVCTQPLHPSCHAGAGWDTKLSHPVLSPRPAPLLGRSELSQGRQQIRTIMLSC